MEQRVQWFMATLIAISVVCGMAKAQAPQAIPYQAAARNSAGVVLPNKTIGLRFTVHDATATGTVVYKETQNAVTNAIGMFIVNIGQGTAVTGTFSAINWGSGGKFMQVEFDSTATGSRYLDLGTQQLMSVPYALNSGNGVPSGTIVAFGGDVNIPSGWVLCDGSEHSTTDPVYANLYTAIGNAWGTSGTGKFNLPNCQGLFLRGKAINTNSFDPDTSGRVIVATGGNYGNHVGSWQNSAFQGHWHLLRDQSDNTRGAAWSGKGNYSSPVNVYEHVALPSTSLSSGIQELVAMNPYTNGTNGIPRTSSETRPINVSVNYIIKL